MLKNNKDLKYPANKYLINVHPSVKYLIRQSEPEKKYYVFSYTIIIVNNGEIPAKLLSRHWYIMDANGKTIEVRGEGVVGEKPHLKPGEKFEYTSYTVIETPVGSMYGSYQMQAEDGARFDVTIPAFGLSIPAILH